MLDHSSHCHHLIQQEQIYMDEALRKRGEVKACHFLSSLLQHQPKQFHILPAIEFMFIIQHNNWQTICINQSVQTYIIYLFEEYTTHKLLR